MSVSSITDQINNDVLVVGGPPLGSHLTHMHHCLRVVSIHVEDGGGHHLWGCVVCVGVQVEVCVCVTVVVEKSGTTMDQPQALKYWISVSFSTYRTSYMYLPGNFSYDCYHGYQLTTFTHCEGTIIFKLLYC